MHCRKITALIALGFWTVATASASAGWFERVYASMRLDFHRNNAWPYTFVYADRDAANAPFAIMIYNGWRAQNTIGEHHFEEGSAILTEAGRIKINWILTQAPEQYRTIFVERAENGERTTARMDSVRQVAERAAPEGTTPEIAETAIPLRGTPAEYIDGTMRGYQESRPAPQLPKAVSDQNGS